MKTSTQDHPQKTFPLQDLPPELRLQVYASAFEGATVTATVVKRGAPQDNDGQHRAAAAELRFAHGPHANLLFASRQTRAEAHHSFWSTAIVRARSTTYSATTTTTHARRRAAGASDEEDNEDVEDDNDGIDGEIPLPPPPPPPSSTRHRNHEHEHASLRDLASLMPRDIARALRHLRRVKVHARHADQNARDLDRFPALRTISLLEGDDCPVARIPTSHLDGTPLSLSLSQFQQFRWHSWSGVWAAERTFFRFKSWLVAEDDRGPGAGAAADAVAAVDDEDGIDPREVLAHKYGIRSLLDGNTKLQCVGVDSFLKFPIDMYGFAQVVSFSVYFPGGVNNPN